MMTKKKKLEYTITFLGDRYKQLEYLQECLKTNSKLKVIIKGLDVLTEVFRQK